MNLTPFSHLGSGDGDERGLRACDAVRTELALGLRQLDNNTYGIVYVERPETSDADGERPKMYVVGDERPAACIYG
jgi:hypothetical protein